MPYTEYKLQIKAQRWHNDLERMRKELAVLYFEVMAHISLGAQRKNTRKLSKIKGLTFIQTGYLTTLSHYSISDTLTS
jgi:hypothetical protein